MTSPFPYLTVQVLLQDGQSILSDALLLYPKKVHDINFAMDCLKYVGKVQIVDSLLQAFCDEFNAATGAVATG